MLWGISTRRRESWRRRCWIKLRSLKKISHVRKIRKWIGSLNRSVIDWKQKLTIIRLRVSSIFLSSLIASLRRNNRLLLNPSSSSTWKLIKASNLQLLPISVTPNNLKPTKTASWHKNSTSTKTPLTAFKRTKQKRMTRPRREKESSDRTFTSYRWRPRKFSRIYRKLEDSWQSFRIKSWWIQFLIEFIIYICNISISIIIILKYKGRNG